MYTSSSVAQSWWLEGVTLMRPFAVGDTQWFLLKDERASSIAGILGVSGTYFVDGGDVKVVESYPYAANHAPGIFVYDGINFFEAFSYNDDGLNLMFSPPDNASLVWNESLYYAPSKGAIVWNSSAGVITGTASFSWDRVVATRTVRIGDGLPVAVTYTLIFNNSVPVSVKAKFPQPDYTTYTNLQSLGPGVLGFKSVNRAGDVVGDALSYSVEGATQVGQAVMTPTSWGTQQIELDFRPDPGVTTVTLNFQSSVDGYTIHAPTLVNTDLMLAANGVKYVVLDDWASNTIQRLRDPDFELKAQFGDVLIYEFVGG